MKRQRSRNEVIARVTGLGDPVLLIGQVIEVGVYGPARGFVEQTSIERVLRRDLYVSGVGGRDVPGDHDA